VALFPDGWIKIEEISYKHITPKYVFLKPILSESTPKAILPIALKTKPKLPAVANYG